MTQVALPQQGGQSQNRYQPFSPVESPTASHCGSEASVFAFDPAGGSPTAFSAPGNSIFQQNAGPPGFGPGYGSGHTLGLAGIAGRSVSGGSGGSGSVSGVLPASGITLANFSGSFSRGGLAALRERVTAAPLGTPPPSPSRAGMQQPVTLPNPPPGPSQNERKSINLPKPIRQTTGLADSVAATGAAVAARQLPQVQNPGHNSSAPGFGLPPRSSASAVMNWKDDAARPGSGGIPRQQSIKNPAPINNAPVPRQGP